MEAWKKYVGQWKPLQLIVLIQVLVLTQIGCGLLGTRLSEEAKPQTAAAAFVVTVAEFNLVATEATIWLDGVVQAAEAGDTEGQRYLPTARAVGRLITTGKSLIDQAQAAFAAGNLTGFLQNGQALNSTLAELQGYMTEMTLGGGQ